MKRLPDRGTSRDTNRHNLFVRVMVSRQGLADEEARLAWMDANPHAVDSPLEHAGLPHAIDRQRFRLYMLERQALGESSSAFDSCELPTPECVVA